MVGSGTAVALTIPAALVIPVPKIDASDPGARPGWKLAAFTTAAMPTAGAVPRDVVNVAQTRVGEVELAVIVLAEGGDSEGGLKLERALPARTRLPERPHAAAAVVAIEVRAGKRGISRASINKAARNGAVPGFVAIFGYRRRDPVHAAAPLVAVHTFGAIPAVVLAAGARGRLEIDFLVNVLSDIADIKVAGGAVEGETPRIAQTVSPNLTAVAALVRERVAGGNRVRRCASFDIDAQNLAEQRVRVLPAAQGIAPAAAIADADVEIAVGTEGELSAVVIRVLPVGDLQNHDLAPGIGRVRRRAQREARDGDVSDRVRVVHVKVTRGRKTRWKSDAQQAALAAAVNALRDIEKRRRDDRTVLNDAYTAGLLDDKKASAGVAGSGYVGRAREAARHLRELNLGLCERHTHTGQSDNTPQSSHV